MINDPEEEAKTFFAQWVDLAFLQTGISKVLFFWGGEVEFRKPVFLDTGHNCCFLGRYYITSSYRLGLKKLDCQYNI